MLGSVLTTLGVWAFILACAWDRNGSPSANPSAWSAFALVVVVWVVGWLALLFLGGGAPVDFGFLGGGQQ